MSILTVTHLRSRSKPGKGGCWHWQGAKSQDGTPRIWTLDYERADKRCISGPKAVFFIAQRCGLNGRIAYRGCFTTDCVNPDHIRTAADKAEIGAALARVGIRKGTAIEQRRANVAKAQAAKGIKPTERAIVLAIRQAPTSVTGRALAAEHGIDHRTVSRIRRNQSHREVCA